MLAILVGEPRRQYAPMVELGQLMGPLEKVPVAYFIENVNSSSPKQNGHHFPDGIFNSIFLNEKVRFLTKISLKFVP